MASVPQPRVLISPVSASKPKPISRRLTSPITPATTAGVTGLVYPSPLESSPSEPNLDDSDFADADDIASVANVTAQNSVWNFVWAEKARKMDKELSKVKSLEEYRPTAILNYVPKSPSPRPALKSMISAPKPVPETPPSIAPSARTHERRSLLQDVLSSERSSNDRDSFFRTPSPALPTIPTILSSPATTPSPAKAPSPPKTPQSLKKKKSITSFRTVPEKNYGMPYLTCGELIRKTFA
ncbi:hypothetical protein K438DRAFT_2014111 [Mycena galopus ATCC 62051]|nr:hypothetical protein K438DRAFT_2014111 [Mycena galopus ATCC 62051]